MSESPRTYFWDFFGPRSLPTAQHFKRHLQGFLTQNGATALEVVEVTLQPNHHGIGVVTPPEHWELIEKALKPMRFA